MKGPQQIRDIPILIFAYVLFGALLIADTFNLLANNRLQS